MSRSHALVLSCLASLFLAGLFPATAFADIIYVNGKQPDQKVRIMRGAPVRCESGPVIIRANQPDRPVRCAVPIDTTYNHPCHHLSLAAVVLADTNIGLYIPLE